MKKLLLVLFSFSIVTIANAQWVVTAAGVLETPGFNDGTALGARFFNPHGIAVDSSGTVYVADRYNHTIRTYTPSTGTVKTLAGKATESGVTDGPGGDARFYEPWGICVTPDGIVYVADTKNQTIRKVMPDGMVSTVAGTGNYGTTDGPGNVATFGNPTGIEIDEAGNIYVADHLTHIIRKVDPNGFVTTIAGIPYIPGDVDGAGNQAQFWRPYGLTLDNQGNILVADEWNHKIRMVTPDGTVSTFAGMGEIGLTNGPAEEARFHFPWDMTVDNLGNVYVADGYNQVVRLIATDGTVSSFAGTPATSGGQDGIGEDASFSGATSIAWSQKDTAIHVGDAYNHLIRTIFIYGLPTPNISLNITSGSAQACAGDDVVLNVTPDFYDDYKFFLGGQLVQEGEGTEYSLTDLLPGSYTLNVVALADTETVTSNSVTITVSELPEPTISAVGPLTFYEGDSVILIANGTGDFFWSHGDDSQSVTIFESGSYFVEETIGECTGASDNVIVEVIPLPDDVSIIVDGEAQVCPGETVTLLSNSPNGDHQWLKDGWPLNGATATFLDVSESGIYQVQVTDVLTSITVLSEGQEITAIPDSDFEFDANPKEGYPGLKVDFSHIGSDSPTDYYWDFGDFHHPLISHSELVAPSYTYEEVGSYAVTLEATDDYGCVHVISKPDFIQIIEEGKPTPELFLPTAFTPNDDGENDVFRIRGAVTGDFSMSVYNQWGEVIFYSDDPSNGWDGTGDGKPLHNGTFVYLVNAETLDGTKQLTGKITLLR